MKIFFLIPCLFGVLFANPQNPEVIIGSADFASTLPDTLEIHTGEKTIIEWEKFSIEKRKK